MAQDVIYNKGQRVQVKYDVDDAHCWLNAEITNVFPQKQRVQIKYLDQVPSPNGLKHLFNNISPRIRPYSQATPVEKPLLKTENGDADKMDIDDDEDKIKKIKGKGKGRGKKKNNTWADKAMIEWSNKDVKSWIESMASYKQYVSAFPKHMDGKELLDTTIDDLVLIIPKKLWRKRFMKQLELAKTQYAKTLSSDRDADADADEEDAKVAPTNKSTNKSRVNGVVGLNNLGNTCYMNTSIQILSQSPYITRYLRKRAKLSKTNTDTNGGGVYNWVWNKASSLTGYGNSNSNIFDYSMLNAWTELCDIIYNRQRVRSNSHFTTTSPANIRNALNTIDNDFGSGRQDDSIRSFDYMLQALDEQIEHEIMQKKKKTDIKYKDNIQIFHGRILTDFGHEEQGHIGDLLRDHNPNNSILRKSFDGIERSICECLQCNKIFQQYATFRIVDLSVISHEIIFDNINIVTNNQCYKLPETLMLDYCSINLIKYHVEQYLSSQHNEEVPVDYHNMKIVTISKNGGVQCLCDTVIKLSELQANCCIFVLVNNNLKHKSHKSSVLQFNLSVGKTGNEITQLSVKYNNYNPKSVQQLINNEIKQQENNYTNDNDEKYDYYYDYNGHISGTNEPITIGGVTGGIDVLILLRVNQNNTNNKQYYYDINKMDKFITFEARERDSNYSSPVGALNKLRQWWSDRNTKVSNMNASDCKDIQSKIDLKLTKIVQSIKVLQKKEYILNVLNAWICNKYKLSVSKPRTLTSLKQCLSEYEKEKLFDETCYAYPCPHCNNGSNSRWIRVQKTIVYSPPIFLFHLDRFGKNMKSNYDVSYQKGQELQVKYGNKDYKTRIEQVNSSGMKVVYLCDSRTEWIASSKYKHKIASSKSNRYNNYYASNKFEHAISYELESDFERATKQRYNLYGVSNHSGSTDGGHYTATIKCLSDGDWYDISDSWVNPISKQQALGHSKSATILAYVRNQQ